MDDGEKKIVMEIVQLYNKLCSLTYDGSRGVRRMLPPNVYHYIRYVEKIRDNVAILCYGFHSDMLSKSNLRDLDDVLHGYELKELKVESKRMSEQRLRDKLEFVTNQIGSAINPLLESVNNL